MVALVGRLSCVAVLVAVLGGCVPSSGTRTESVEVSGSTGEETGLGAYLAKTVYDRPSTLLSIVRRVPPGLGYLLRPESPKNAHKSAGYPRELTVRELAGLAWGPVAYAAGRIDLRRQGRRAKGLVPGPPR